MPKTARPLHRAPLTAALSGLRTLARLLVYGHFRLRRRGPGVRGVHVVFGATVLAPREAPSGVRDGPQTEGSPLNPRLSAAERALLKDLGQALERLGDRRAVFRHLVYLERQVARAGLGGLSGLPDDVLRKTFDQLSLVSANDRELSLVELHTRLSRLLVQRGHRDHLLVDDHATPSDFLRHAQPLVAEARISEFLTAAQVEATERR